ncbi:hypothetical protein CC78DRAFT_273887 [Lojkania enalia]|uniref:ferric-chelate reductase (NADPH) n=1 Tax=Lojkania enalia TaxID=147567 RepID=A0A9P4N5I6_9PLEO|nr:hypothetical protein CC78DRAFT_273887 [Didymosphaeria enalia]
MTTQCMWLWSLISILPAAWRSKFLQSSHRVITNLPSGGSFQSRPAYVRLESSGHVMPPSQVYAPPGWPSTPLPPGVSVEDLPITDPHCTNDTCRAFREGFADDERKTPLLRLLEYGTWTVWFYSFWILLFTAIYVYHQTYDRLTRVKQLRGRPSFRDKAVASIRFWAYRRPNNRFTRKIGLRQVSYGTLALLAFSTVYFGILPWPQQRYLRALFRFGSPPLSVRCAMVISALTPLTVALAGKVNVITWMTGFGYERLNVFHRYVAYVIFCLATIHTVPHLIAPVRDGGWSMLNALYANEKRELSGTPLYFATFGLAFFSIPWIRGKFYEAFKYVHIFLAVSYIGLFWWHIYGEYMSPYYIYATVAIFFFSNIVRLLHRHRNLRSISDISGFPTTITQLHGNTTRVCISVPKSMRWKPGQHAFLRMPRISWIANHPFSITNIPSNEEGSTHDIIFLVRSHDGFTKKLLEYQHGQTSNITLPNPFHDFDSQKAKIVEKEKFVDRDTKTEHIEDVSNGTLVDAITVVEEEVASPMSPYSQTSCPISLSPSPSRTNRRSSVSSFPPRDEITENKIKLIAQKAGKQPSFRTIIDGPYGTHHRPLHKIYDTVLCVAGGSGITASLPHILDLTQRLKNQRKDEVLSTKRIHLVWIIRDAEWVSWIENELNTAIRNIREHPSPNACSFTIDIFVTRSAALAESASPSESELSPVSTMDPKTTLPFLGETFAVLGDPEKDAVPLPAKPRPILRRLNGEKNIFDDEVHFGIINGEGHTSRGVSVAMHHCRPLVRDVVESYISGDRAIVLGCGPPSLSAELSQTAAALQQRVWKGEMSELKLDIETFGW